MCQALFCVLEMQRNQNNISNLKRSILVNKTEKETENSKVIISLIMKKGQNVIKKKEEGQNSV